MPYSSLQDLPDPVKSHLPIHAQEIYFSAFNSAYQDTCKGREDRDRCAASIAWAAVKKSYKKESSGEWKQKESGKENGNVTDFEQFEETIPAPMQIDSKSGVARVRIIKPGWGSSGYYHESMLMRDAERVYSPGTQMFLDHPSAKEEKERPERSIRDLGGVLIGGVKYEKDGPIGPGVYADVLTFKANGARDFLTEIAPFIGISHRVLGKSKTGEAEGKKGPIIESLDKAISVDYVTVPGAGGGIVQFLESWRKTGKVQIGDQEQQEDDTMEITAEAVRKNPTIMKELREAILAEQEEGGSKEEELMAQIEEYKKKIAELEAELEGMKEKETVGEAMRIATVEVGKTALPEVTKQRLVESLPAKIAMKDGKLDTEKFQESIKEAVKVETDYIAKLTEAGKVRGFGGKPSDQNGKATLKESFKDAFLAMGMSKEEAEKKAIIAAEGR